MIQLSNVFVALPFSLVRPMDQHRRGVRCGLCDCGVDRRTARRRFHAGKSQSIDSRPTRKH